MSQTLDTKPALSNISELERAVLETLSYSDVFEYPLTFDELHRFLTVSATLAEVYEGVVDMKDISSTSGYYFLAGRNEIVYIRKQREENSRKAYRRAIFYGRILGSLPFIRMVALTGSLAMLNLSKNRDMDYMLVTKPGRVWTARAFALLFGRVARLFGDIICPNVIVSENALEWKERNLYTAREFAQMILIGGEDVYHHLRVVNKWIKDFLPNVNTDSTTLDFHSSRWEKLQSLLELSLKGKIGNLFESWEMNRKIARFQKQAGYGAETNFSVNVCQGNFDHHGSWTLKAYKERLRTLSLLGHRARRVEGRRCNEPVEVVRVVP